MTGRAVAEGTAAAADSGSSLRADVTGRAAGGPGRRVACRSGTTGAAGAAKGIEDVAAVAIGLLGWSTRSRETLGVAGAAAVVGGGTVAAGGGATGGIAAAVTGVVSPEAGGL